MHGARVWLLPVAIVVVIATPEASWAPDLNLLNGSVDGLDSNQPPADQPLADPTRCLRITVKTQNTSGAGTDANITATLTDLQGVSVSWVLNPQMSGDAFERGSTDAATYCTDDTRFNIPRSLSLYSDGWGSGSAWDVESVEIRTTYPVAVSPKAKYLAYVDFSFHATLDDEQTLVGRRVSADMVQCTKC